MTMHLKARRRVLTLLLLAAPPAIHSAPSQSPPLSPEGTSPPPVLAREDPALETAIASSFDQLRSSRHLRPLARIPSDLALRQITCTAAQSGKLIFRDLSLEANGPSALFRITDPSRLPPDFVYAAGYDDRGADPSHNVSRYSVSVWHDPGVPEIAWVGIALYWSHLRQVFAVHITHVYRNPDILDDLTPACVSLP